MHRRILASAAAAALTFALAACGDEGENGTVTTPPPSVSVDGSDGVGDAPSDDGSSTDGDGNDASDGGGDSTAAAPDIPAPDPADYPGMDQNTPEGAEQAFRYYVAKMTWAYQTGGHAELTEQHSSTCNTCRANADAIRKNAEKGQYWGPTLIEEGKSAVLESENFDAEVGYEFHLSAHTEPSEDGRSPEEHPRTKYTAVAGMNWEHGSWKIGALTFDIEAAPGD